MRACHQSSRNIILPLIGTPDHARTTDLLYHRGAHRRLRFGRRLLAQYRPFGLRPARRVHGRGRGLRAARRRLRRDGAVAGLRRRDSGSDPVRGDAHAGDRRRYDLEPRGRHDSRADRHRARRNRDAVRDVAHAVASRRRDRRADHLRNRQRLSRYLRAAVRDRVAGVARRAGRGGRDLAAAPCGNRGLRWPRRESR